MNILQKQMNDRIQKHDTHNVLKEMGYSSTAIDKANTRLANLLADPLLGVGSGGYDFKYSNREFLIVLCRILDINSNLVDMFLKDSKELAIRKAKAYRSHIFIDTGFKRTTQSIFVLAFMGSKRNISFSIEECILPKMQQIEIASNKARVHYKESKGSLKLWGDIDRYVFQCEENIRIIIDKDGEIIKDDGGFSRTKATTRP